ncbi:hypothetical protein DSM03_1011075 [Leeuwenhoekiella aestuarii]|uniref:RiboL-PSP-HEPN domain-containing protein n=1 Tax=Leeuwenhoekiella aestuarii TaxID=2249426 RepID=A0A4Q0NZJ3_9FLAO|nr:hypothetical protein [Leeuwenhoekiella aestuarii]RXG18393.1 hypothetical protein DSM04_101586 [Leeuwenhoekiella aestuarii]RXG19698.1 hypothetical protein DSM03_1011075 [Leeuwenhoekiella aestuarii]
MNKFNLLSQATAIKLFRTTSAIVEYVVIEEELNELFNYCILLQESTQDKIDQLVSEREELEKESYKRFEFDGIQFKNIDTIDGIENFEIPSWNALFEFTVPMNQILLISIFLEKSLKSLCAEYSPNNDSTYYDGYNLKIKRNRQESLICTYIKYLEQQCGLKNVSNPTIEYLNQNIRPLRNSFVHGDWMTIKRYTEEIDINEVFISVSNLFRIIEEKYLNKSNANI